MEVDMEKPKEESEELLTLPFPWFEGVPYPIVGPIAEKGVEKAISDVINMPCRESDIIICAHPKCGTHWVNEMLHMMLNNTTVLQETAKFVTMVEAQDIKNLDALPSPRLLNCHYRFKYLPKELKEKKCKIIHVVRNPKDVCVSYFHHSKKCVFTRLVCPWDEYLDKYLKGEVAYGSWFDYVLEMDAADKENPGLIYTCYYEDFKRQPEEEIRKLARHIGLQTSDEMIKKIVNATSFENMQKNKFDVTASLTGGKGFVYRKGQIGDWKNHFTVAQNEEFDRFYNEKMKGASYRITFE